MKRKIIVSLLVVAFAILGMMADKICVNCINHITEQHEEAMEIYDHTMLNRYIDIEQNEQYHAEIDGYEWLDGHMYMRYSVYDQDRHCTGVGMVSKSYVENMVRVYQG